MIYTEIRDAKFRLGGPTGLKAQDGRPGFCRARTEGAEPGWGGGSDDNVLSWLSGIRTVLERCWLGSMLGPPDFMQYWSGLGLSFWKKTLLHLLLRGV